MRGYPPVLGAAKTYTPAITWAGNTIAGATGVYMKVPGFLQLWVSFQETAGIAVATLTIPLPPGYVGVTQAGSLVSGVGLIGNSVGTASISMSIAAAGTAIVSMLSVAGVVSTWAGGFTVPVTA